MNAMRYPSGPHFTGPFPPEAPPRKDYDAALATLIARMQSGTNAADIGHDDIRAFYESLGPENCELNIHQSSGGDVPLALLVRSERQMGEWMVDASSGLETVHVLSSKPATIETINNLSASSRKLIGDCVIHRHIESSRPDLGLSDDDALWENERDPMDDPEAVWNAFDDRWNIREAHLGNFDAVAIPEKPSKAASKNALHTFFRLLKSDLTRMAPNASIKQLFRDMSPEDMTIGVDVMTGRVASIVVADMELIAGCFRMVLQKRAWPDSLLLVETIRRLNNRQKDVLLRWLAHNYISDARIREEALAYDGQDVIPAQAVLPDGSIANDSESSSHIRLPPENDPAVRELHERILDGRLL